MSRFDDNSENISKMKALEMNKIFGQLQAFTNNLESKVNNMLKAQETEFVNSYKVHMDYIKQQLRNLTIQLKKKQQLIQSYQNQGKMAYLLKRVNFLQIEEKKLLSYLQKKKSQIRQLQLQKVIQQSQIKRLQQKVKQLIKARVKAEQHNQRDHHNASYDSIPTFTTQIAYQNSKKALSKMITQQRSIKLKSLHQKSQRSDISANPELILDNQNNKLQRQLSSLRKKNRQLLSFSSKYISDNSIMENFFIQTVNQIKKNISVRKKVKQCTFDDFRKQDKLELLIKVLSNDDILFKLYSLIFNKDQNPFKQQKPKIDRPLSLRGKLNLNRSIDYHLPSLNSARIP